MNFVRKLIYCREVIQSRLNVVSSSQNFCIWTACTDGSFQGHQFFMMWKIYVLLDATVFGVIFICCVASLIYFVAVFPTCYASGVILRVSVLLLSCALLLYYALLPVGLIDSVNALLNSVIVVLKSFICLALHFALQQWNCLCKNIECRLCYPVILAVIIIPSILLTGITQLCTYFVERNMPDSVFFYVNTLTTYIQMEFIISYGSFRIYARLTDNLNTYRCIRRFLIGMFANLVFMGAFGFSCFIASFCVDLHRNDMIQLFTGLCHRLPMIVELVSVMIFMGLMDKILATSLSQNTRTVGLFDSPSIAE